MFAPPRCAISAYAFADGFQDRYLDTGVFWSASADPSLVSVRALRDDASPDSIDVKRLPAAVTVLRLDDGSEFVRLTSNAHSISIAVTEGSVLDGPVKLVSQIEDLRTVPAQIQTLDRLHTLWRLKQFRKKDFKPDRRASRWLLALRALDLDEARLNHREISNQILAADDPETWKREKNSLRARTRRLVTLGRELRDGGYLAILGGTTTLLGNITPLV